MENEWRNVLYKHKLTDLVESDDMWMVQKFHDFYFSVEFFQIWGIQTSFVDDFNGNLLIDDELKSIYKKHTSQAL